jgi:hypothetical protein
MASISKRRADVDTNLEKLYGAVAGPLAGGAGGTGTNF